MEATRPRYVTRDRRLTNAAAPKVWGAKLVIDLRPTLPPPCKLFEARQNVHGLSHVRFTIPLKPAKPHKQLPTQPNGAAAAQVTNMPAPAANKRVKVRI